MRATLLFSVGGLCSWPDTHLADADAHTHWAERVLALGVLAHIAADGLRASAAPDAATAALLDVLRTELRIGTSAHRLLLIYELVLQLGDRNPNAFRWLLYGADGVCVLPGLVRRLMHNVWAGHYAGQTKMLAPEHASVGPALPLPGSAHRVAQPAPVDGRISSAGLQVWLQFKALALLYELLCNVRFRLTELGTLRSKTDAACIGEPFVGHLFDQAEATRAHDDETLGVLVTQLLLALNEQHLAVLQDAGAPPFSVLDVIRDRAHATRTFSENVVFMLNRTPSADAAGCRFHMLVLKLLDALFAMPETASYFYVNDLKVLVDLFLRHISDLPERRELLRQAYLRVLPALLTQTQLCTVAYKREAIQQMLTTIVQYAAWNGTAPRTLALAHRCLDAEWCVCADPTPMVAPVRGGTAQPELLVEEHTKRGPLFHAETSDAALHTLLELGRMQSAAVAYASGDAMPCWPPAPPAPPAPSQDALVVDLDVGHLEQATSGRTSPLSSASSHTTGRRRAPPPPVSPRAPPVGAPAGAAADALAPPARPRADSCEMPARRKAPEIPIPPAARSTPDLSTTSSAPPTRSLASLLRVPRGFRSKAARRPSPSPPPPPRRRAAPKPPVD